MSFDTKQILHIITEIIVVVSITIYFVNKNNQMLKHIEELEAKIKQQEEILQNHDNLILKIMNTVNMLSQQQQYIPQQHVQVQPQVQPQVQHQVQFTKTKQLPKNISSTKKVVVILPKKEEEKPKFSKIEEIIEEEDEEECDEEENLDDELLEELKDLDEEHHIEDVKEHI
jgi:predicted RND superfamily exporter protein